MHKTVSKPPESLQAQQASKKDYKHTSKIEFLGVGASENGDRFIKRRVGDDVALISVAKLMNEPNEEFTRLQRAGVTLLQHDARREFMERAQHEAGKQPGFDVVTKTGWHGDVFVLPDGLMTNMSPGIERYFDLSYAQYQHRLRRVGKRERWIELAKLCRGKTRLVAALCQQFSGPVCAAFGFEAPGLQLVSEGGLGKTTIGRVAASVWGGDPNPVKKLGCGVSWNNTNLNLEVVAAAFNEMALFLDDMHKATKADVEAIIEIMNGEGRGRLTEKQRAEYCTPLLSTSNTSVIAIARDLKIKNQYGALIDRVVDLPLPEGCAYFFEGVRNSDELRMFGNCLRDLSRKNFGLAGPEFVRRLAIDLKADRQGSKALAEARQRTFWNAAASIESRGDRDLTRVGDKLATIYAAGCLASSYHILPFTDAELLNALLICLRDHVSFIDDELGIASTLADSPDAVMARATTAGTVQQSFERLKKFITAGGFVDLRKGNPMLPLAVAPIGYIGEHGGRNEYWLTNPRFEAVAGGKREGQRLKAQLLGMGLLSTELRGRGLGLVVKRPIPGADNRARVVAIRAAPQSQVKTPQGQRQATP